jgi:hypothetical protein
MDDLVVEIIEPVPLEIVLEEVAIDVEMVAEQGLPGPKGGDSVFAVAASTVNGHRVVAESAPGRVAHLDLLNAAHAETLLGISKNAASPEGSVEVVTGDLLSDPSFAFTPESPVFAGASGLLTQSPPAYPTALFSVCVGVAVSSTAMRVAIESPIYL